MPTRSEQPGEALWRLCGRARRRYGGYLVHMGVLMIALGFIGDAYFKEETQGTLAIGEQVAVGNWCLRFDGLAQDEGSDGREVFEASISIFKDGALLKELKPRRDFFLVQQQPVTVPGVYSTLGGDLYVLLVGWEEIGLSASTFKVYLNPRVNWTWLQWGRRRLILELESNSGRVDDPCQFPGSSCRSGPGRRRPLPDG